MGRSDSKLGVVTSDKVEQLSVRMRIKHSKLEINMSCPKPPLANTPYVIYIFDQFFIGFYSTWIAQVPMGGPGAPPATRCNLSLRSPMKAFLPYPWTSVEQPLKKTWERGGPKGNSQNDEGTSKKSLFVCWFRPYFRARGWHWRHIPLRSHETSNKKMVVEQGKSWLQYLGAFILKSMS